MCVRMYSRTSPEGYSDVVPTTKAELRRRGRDEVRGEKGNARKEYSELADIEKAENVVGCLILHLLGAKNSDRI